MLTESIVAELVSIIMEGSVARLTIQYLLLG
jgi:hypothetical protein